MPDQDQKTMKGTMYTKEELKEKVSVGASFLDEKDAGWERRIDTNILDIRWSDVCILAQLSGEMSYTSGMYSFGLPGAWEAERMGFCVPTGTHSDDYEDTNDILVCLWKEEIEKRTCGGSASSSA